MKTIFHLLLVLIVFSACRETNSIEEKPELYGERYRPQYHYSVPTQWMNDPNGMVYYDGEYHLFYQHYPDSNVWGPMHWGHAVSTDLVSWKNLPIALYPDSLGMIFSGSCVMDLNNTSGLGTEDNPPMVAIFTHHLMEGEKSGAIDFQYQSLAYSTDRGRTWTKYADNPVLDNPGIKDFRDPKVSWFEEWEKWIMVLAVKDHVNFYSSNNLINWQLESEFGKEIGAHGGVWECPDLFKLKTADGTEKWIMLLSINPGGPQGGSATQYFVGDFDGKAFTPDDENIRWIDLGADNYAGVTWSNIPEEDGRRLFIGWMSNWDYARNVPTYVWRSAMTIPRELQIIKVNDEIILTSIPVSEMESLRGERRSLQSGNNSLEWMTSEIELEFESPNHQLVFSNESEKLVVAINDSTLSIDRSGIGDRSIERGFHANHIAPIREISPQQLRIFLDESSIEVFVNDGELVITDLIFPIDTLTSLEIRGDINDGEIYQVRSIWK
ncbi:MAG: glycoside hydrolase family 32 protein [bacterium]|nr:glycoside hydrolase family 32 protein [bacterium]